MEASLEWAAGAGSPSYLAAFLLLTLLLSLSSPITITAGSPGYDGNGVSEGEAIGEEDEEEAAVALRFKALGHSPREHNVILSFFLRFT